MRTITFVITVIATQLLCGCGPTPGEATALQGLRGNTLVAGKSTAFRLFADGPTYTAANRIDATIVRPDGSQLIQSWSRADFVTIPTSSRGPSLVVRVLGKDLPWVGNYQFTAQLFNAGGALLASYLIDQVQLLPTKDVIVAIDRINADAVNPGTPAEIQAARDAMQRLAGIWPIRDGISTPDGDRSAGLRYVINNNPQPHGCNGDPKVSDCQLCPFFGSWINRPAGADVMNLGIAYRFQDPGENVGGIAPNFCPNQPVGWASIVMSAPVAPGFGQESGHVFGLEPKDDPHFDVTVQAGHSKDNMIDPSDAELGFDVQLNRRFLTPTYDAMHQVVCGCSNNRVSYNSWDWEFLRKQFVKLASTGPSAPEHFMSNVAPAVAGVGDNVYFIARRRDGRIFYNRAKLGEGGVGWAEMEGSGLTDAAPAAGAVGNHIFVAIKGLDGNLYANQADLGQPFGQWFPMGFASDVAPAVVGVGDSVYFFAKRRDGRVFYNRAKLGEGGVGWVEVQGGGRTDAAPAAGAVGTHVFLAIKGLDGNLYVNQADLGRPFGQWFPTNFASDVTPAVTGVGDNVYFFAKRADGLIFYNRAKLGEGGVGWVEVQGDGLTDAAPAAGTVGTHVFLMIKGLDSNLYVNQADLGHVFGEWFP